MGKRGELLKFGVFRGFKSKRMMTAVLVVGLTVASLGSHTVKAADGNTAGFEYARP